MNDYVTVRRDFMDQVMWERDWYARACKWLAAALIVLAAVGTFLVVVA